MDKKLNGFNNGRDTTDGVGGRESLEDNMKWCAENMPLEESKTLKNKVFEALGEVSMCWSETPKGVFDSINAERIGNELMDEIENDLPNAIKVLQKHLSEDKSEGSYYHSWMCNLKIAFFDTLKHDWDYEYQLGFDTYTGDEELLVTAEKAAKNFLDLLIKE